MVRHLDRIGAIHHELDVHSKNPFRWPKIRRQLKALLVSEELILYMLDRVLLPGLHFLPRQTSELQR